MDVVARSELMRMGFSKDQIERMRSSRRLHNVHDGVYAVGHDFLTRRGHWMAAVLASGPGALLGHRSAGALTHLRQEALTYVELTVAQRRGNSDGIRAYVITRLAPQDRDERHAIPCVSPALVLLQLAAITTRRSVERAMDEARSQIERDRRNESDLVRAGYRVLRATSRQVQRAPRDVALMVAAALNGPAAPRAEVCAPPGARIG